MIERVLSSIGGVGIFGILSLCLFFGFFAGMLIWAIRLNKSYVDAMRELPLARESAAESKPATDSTLENRYE